jgi:hypothetical protein
MPFEFGAVYISETGHTTEERTKKHHGDLRSYHPERWTTAEHSTRNKIYFENAMASANLPHYTSRVTRETTENNVHENRNGIGGYRKSCLEDHPNGQAAYRMPQIYSSPDLVPKRGTVINTKGGLVPRGPPPTDNPQTTNVPF